MSEDQTGSRSQSTAQEPLTLETLEAAIETIKKQRSTPTPYEVLLEQYLNYLGIQIGPWIYLNPMGVDGEGL